MSTRKIIQAIRRRDQAMLATLLAKGHSPTRRPCDCDSPLGLAAEYSTPEIVRLLLDAGAPVEEYKHCDFSPLYRAIYHRDDEEGRLEIVRLLVDRGADMRRFTGSPSIFYVAIKARRYEVARLLLDRGCPIFPFWSMSGEENPAFLVSNVQENPRFQRLFHEKIADYLATQVGSELYGAYYAQVPFKPDRAREAEIQARELRRRIEEQRLLRDKNPSESAEPISGISSSSFPASLQF